MSVRARNSKNIATIDLIFLHKKFYTRAGSGLNNFLKDEIKLRDRTTYAIKVWQKNMKNTLLLLHAPALFYVYINCVPHAMIMVNATTGSSFQ